MCECLCVGVYGRQELGFSRVHSYDFTDIARIFPAAAVNSANI